MFQPIETKTAEALNSLREGSDSVRKPVVTFEEMRDAVGDDEAGHELIGQLRDELPRKGYRLITPPGTTSPLLSCVLPNAKGLLTDPLARAQVRLSVHDNYFRISPSLFNDDRDVERLIAALPRV